MGSMLKHNIRSERPLIVDKEELWKALVSAKNRLSRDREYFNLIKSMPRRLNDVIEANGGPTKY